MDNSASLTPEKKAHALKVFREKACNVSLTCEAIGISRTAWYAWKESDPEFKEKVKEIDESLIDLAETQLMKNIRDGKETSLIFFLKNKAPDRWRDRKELDFVGALKLVEVDK